MTACAIEDETAGAARTTAAAGPTPEAAEPDGPAEPVKPLGADAPDEGADPAGAGTPDDDADPGGARTGPGGAAASTGPGPHGVPHGAAASAGTSPHGVPGGAAPSAVTDPRGASVPPAPSAPPVPSVPPASPAPSAPPAQAAPRVNRAEAPRPPTPSRLVPPALTLAADHTYAARLTPAGEAEGPGWYPERWTLDGPEPYAVPLPLDQPEDASSDVLPLSDGRVLIRREVEPGTHTFSLLYPTGPGTGEVSLGALDCPEFVLLPRPRTA